MTCCQLELFPKTELDLLREEVSELKKRLSNVQGGLFARHKDLADEIDRSREREDKLNDAVNQLRERLNHYEEALFPELGAELGTEVGTLGAADVGGVGVAPGERLRFMPVSCLITSSQATSTGLLFPQK